MLHIILFSLLVQVMGFKDLPSKTNRMVTWKEAYKECGKRFAGSKLNCGPAYCKVKMSSKVTQQTFGRYEYWVNGYVHRKPGYIYTGCYSINRNDTTLSNWYDYPQRNEDRKVTIYSNSPGDCLQKCDDTEVEGLRVCVTRLTKYNQNPPEHCDHVCGGDKDERCGGYNYYSLYSKSSKLFYSGYKKFREADTGNKLVSETCAVVRTRNMTKSTILEKNCEKMFRYICETFDEEAKALKSERGLQISSLWKDFLQILLFTCLFRKRENNYSCPNLTI